MNLNEKLSSILLMPGKAGTIKEGRSQGGGNTYPCGFKKTGKNYVILIACC